MPTEQFPAQPKRSRSKAPVVVSDPALHRALHVHDWRVLGSVRQCRTCLELEANDE